jgi:purine nucleosidase/pyrimidine-specific ribonucleoside hydrolase
MKNVLIDCDPGIDDAVAIMLALKSPELELRAITAVSGNMTSDYTAANALRILELMGRSDIPVAQGPLAPLKRPYPRDPFSHGDDGLGNTGLPAPITALDSRDAAQLIVDTVNAHAGDISIAALGPLTNLALALQIDPHLPSKVTEVYAIAGAFGFTPYAFSQATGDNPVSEWNVYVDPEAAKIVFDAGFRFTAVSLDVCTHPAINLSDARLNRLRHSDRREATLTAEIVDFVRAREYQSYCALIDSLAIAGIVDDGLLTVRDVAATVETTSDLTLGMTVMDVRNHHRWSHLPTIRATADADFESFLDLLVGRLTA